MRSKLQLTFTALVLQIQLQLCCATQDWSSSRTSLPGNQRRLGGAERTAGIAVGAAFLLVIFIGLPLYTVCTHCKARDSKPEDIARHATPRAQAVPVAIAHLVATLAPLAVGASPRNPAMDQPPPFIPTATATMAVLPTARVIPGLQQVLSSAHEV